MMVTGTCPALAAFCRAGGDSEREATRLRYVGIVVSRRQHELEQGRELIERARAMFASSRGPRFDFDVASCDGIEFDRGHPDVALPLFLRVAEVREHLFGENHPSVAVALVNVGETLTKLGRAQEALPILRRSLELAGALSAKGGDAYEHNLLVTALRATGDPAGALDEDERSRASYDRAGESGRYWESFPLTGLGLDLLALGRPREAVPLLERAVELRLTQPVAFEVSESRFALARALWATGDAAARLRARTVALQARDDVTEDAERYGGTFAASRHEIEDWMERHPPA
jgi:tetratricopeptide (TPR) repeat protein